jgi:spore coat protein U-like protein
MLIVIALMVAAETWGQGCAVSVVGVAFGSYDNSAMTPLDSTGDVSVICDAGINFAVRLDPGQNSTTFHPRMLMLIGERGTLDYNLYRNSAHTEVFGDGTNNTYIHVGVGTGSEVNVPIYGRIPGAQIIPPGQYSDAVTVIVEW